MLRALRPIYDTKVFLVEVSDNQIPTLEFDSALDCFVVLLNSITPTVREQLAVWICSLNVGWVEVLGRDSEFLHDTIDEQSVRNGLQAKIGDGVPMTTWHEYPTVGPSEMKEIVAYLQTGGQGDSHIKVVVVVGDQAQVGEFAKDLES